MLTPNVVNKVVAFEMICSANGYVPDYFVFRFFFRFCLTGDKCTFLARRGGHALVLDGRTPKNWQDKWLWVNQELVGSGRYRANTFADTITKLFPHNREVADYLKKGTPEDAASREMVLVNDIGVGGNGKDYGASGDGRAGAGGGGVDGVAGDNEVSNGLAGKGSADDVVEGAVVGDKSVGDGSRP
ncbi:unnamed protein product [Lactuca saligna]|uniref:Uncharacterized protein n=1 Tax=Lactuca saligna TaxID=75948 RepID=A0AA36EAP0_LACSI|nr:unnamed protein product [Lactuca saligna]